jgi:hypothetical protein
MLAAAVSWGQAGAPSSTASPRSQHSGRRRQTLRAAPHPVGRRPPRARSCHTEARPCACRHCHQDPRAIAVSTGTGDAGQARWPGTPQGVLLHVPPPHAPSWLPLAQQGQRSRGRAARRTEREDALQEIVALAALQPLALARRVARAPVVEQVEGAEPHAEGRAVVAHAAAARKAPVVPAAELPAAAAPARAHR